MIYIPILYIILIIISVFILQTIIVLLVVKRFVKRAKAGIMASLDSIYTMTNNNITNQDNVSIVNQEHFANIRDTLLSIYDTQVSNKTTLDSVVIGTNKHNKQTHIFISNFNKLFKDDLAGLSRKRRGNTISKDKSST